MTISYLQAGKFVGEKTNWNTTRSRLHKILFLSSLIYAHRTGGNVLISDDDFYAESCGPVLKKLDKRIDAFGARAYKNLFNGISLEKANKESLKVIEDCIHHYEASETYSFINVCKGYAWNSHYSKHPRAITPESIYEQAILLLNKTRMIKVVNNKFSYPVTVEKIDFLDITNEIAKPYQLNDNEKKHIETLLEINGSKTLISYVSIEGNELLYFKHIDAFSNIASKVLAYEDEKDQDLFMMAYLNGDLF